VTSSGRVLRRPDPLPVREADAPHDSEGTSTALLGMLLFICSEIMFFAGLFGVYFNTRASFAQWPPEGFELELALPIVVTAILITSSFTMQLAVWRIRRGDRTGMNRAIMVTVLLGVIFLALQVFDYITILSGTPEHPGWGINSGIYGTLFYSLTGFHGAHVLGGVLGMSVVLLRGLSGQFSARHHAAVEAVSAYWHFVDVVWVALFVTIYLLR